MKESDIAERWENRVVPNGWDEMGAEGAIAYLEKYGRGIKSAKVQALADYARKMGCDDFAEELEERIR